jgi:hypothetical protein
MNFVLTHLRIVLIVVLFIAFAGLLALSGRLSVGFMPVILVAALVGGVLLRLIFPKG